MTDSMFEYQTMCLMAMEIEMGHIYWWPSNLTIQKENIRQAIMNIHPYSLIPAVELVIHQMQFVLYNNSQPAENNLVQKTPILINMQLLHVN